MIDVLSESGLLDCAEAARFRRVGHFIYESGDHGDTWLTLNLLFADPRRLLQAATVLAERLRPYAPDLVCGPLVGGALVGRSVAHALNVPFVYAESQAVTATEERRYAIPRPLRPLVYGARAVVVDDAINAGFATLACLREIEADGGKAVAVGALLMRTPGTLALWSSRGLGVVYLVGVPWSTWLPSDCPLCRKGVAIETPG